MISRPSASLVDGTPHETATDPAGGRADEDVADTFAQDLLGVGREPGVGHEDVRLLQRRDRGDADHAPLGVVGDHDEALTRLGQCPAGLSLEQVGAGEPGALVHPVHAQEHEVEVQRAQRRHRDRADERVRRRPDSAGEHDGLVGARAAVEDAGDLHGVGHDGDPGDLEQALSDSPGRGARREPDGEAGLDQGGGQRRDGVLLGPLAAGLGLEAGLVGAVAARDGRAAVDLVDHSLAGQLVEVAAHSHVRDLQLAGQVADPDRASVAHPLGDVGLSLPCEHPRSRPSRRGGPSQQKRTVHLWESVGSCVPVGESVSGGRRRVATLVPWIAALIDSWTGAPPTCAPVASPCCSTSRATASRACCTGARTSVTTCRGSTRGARRCPSMTRTCGRPCSAAGCAARPCAAPARRRAVATGPRDGPSSRSTRTIRMVRVPCCAAPAPRAA